MTVWSTIQISRVFNTAVVSDINDRCGYGVRAAQINSDLNKKIHGRVLRVWKFWNGKRENGFGKERLVTSRVTTSLAREELKERKKRNLERNRKSRLVNSLDNPSFNITNLLLYNSIPFPAKTTQSMQLTNCVQQLLTD